MGRVQLYVACPELNPDVGFEACKGTLEVQIERHSPDIGMMTE